jgi:hypothetical protein
VVREVELKKKYARNSVTLTKELSSFKAHETKISAKRHWFCFLARCLRKLSKLAITGRGGTLECEKVAEK